MRTGAQILWECLIGEGVKHVFGYPGGAILPAYDALCGYPEIHHVLVRHEQGATHMADGYARAGGGVGVAMATSGPGATNMVTGIATAMMDSSPIVCITGQVGSKFLGTDAFQETDITGITLPITKHNYLVKRAEDVAPTLRAAFQLARSGRPGPVLVDITKDAQQSSCEFDRSAYIPMALTEGKQNFDADQYATAIDMINASERPVILAGHGVLLSNAMDELREFAERASIPIAMTLLGIGGFPASHPLNLGMMGMHGEAWVNHAIQEADLLLAFGMRFDDRVTGTLKTYAPHAKKIHVEIDPAEINKNVRVDIALLGDVRQVLTRLIPDLAREDRQRWLHYIDELKGDSAVRDIQKLPDSGHLYAAHVIHDLWRETNGNSIVVTDVGQHQMWEAQYYKHEQPRSLITSGGLGTMGFALPAAIGAKFARPEAEIWVIAGDGGFQMTMAELATAAQEELDLNIAVINNGYLGMVRQWQEFFYDRRYSATPLLSPDFAKLAEAFGLLGITARSRNQVAPAIREARQRRGTALINFMVEQEDSVFPMVPSGAALHQMIRRPSPLVETAASEA
ncbi:MAG: biosynthetic-type acetolactate synthase large subunit [Acidobacteria bacterium]|nr:MAG: biosynthetic-type acetolactate synthase large subunit [Acidobacteriota bacterium]PYY20450.1 MAG: biosynthetic-type acetolactate synthase large subunit [Acidobacteriota bacterium]